MNRIVKRIGIHGMKGLLKAAYAPLKLFPVKPGKVLFCSRQSNTMPLDYELIINQLNMRSHEPDYTGAPVECVAVLHRIGDGMGEYLRFAGNTLKSMYHLATSQVCVLDSYWPAVSILHHKKSLKVVQIWHALGKLKKTGKVAVGEVSGRDKDTAELLNMHANNDYIIAGAKVWNPFYCDSFGCTEDMIYNYGLPRIDYLIDTEAENRRKFFEAHPDFAGKPIILYVPTFRRNMKARWPEIVDAVDYSKYNLIVKNHPTQRIDVERPEGNVRYFDDIPSTELLAVADYVITDYSSIALEAAVLRKKTLFWVYDYEEYLENNGLNINLYEAAPGHVFKDINELMKFIDEGRYDMDVLDRYREAWLPRDLGHSAEKIAGLILNILKTGKAPESRE